MIDKALDLLARIIELALALAFIVAVLLNFTNVLGRYLFGLSLLGSDEVQVFVMVAMTFLGAVVVTRRNEHLRMDVLVRFMPASLRVVLRIAEQLSSFCLPASCFRNRIFMPPKCSGSDAPATWPASPCGFRMAPSRSALH